MVVVAMAISLGAAQFLDTSDLPNKATARKFAWDLSHSLTTGGRNRVALEWHSLFCMHGKFVPL